MQVTVEDLSPVKKKLRIEIAQDKVSSELDAAYNQLKKTAKIKGFRPGKVPRSVLERMFKKDVHADVTSRLIQESFIDAIKNKDLKIIGSPQVDPPELNDNGPYAYDATVEISPQLDDLDFDGLSLQKTDYQISDADIESQLKKLQKNMAQLVPIDEERAATEGDAVLIDFEGLKDGKPFAETQKTENFTVKLGEGKVLEDLETGIIGMVPGEHRDIKVTFPGDYYNKKLANLEIDFQVTLNEIRKEILPEIDDELAKKTGKYQTLDELKQALVENLENGYEKRVEQELNEQIFEALLEKQDFEVPETMVEYELNSIVEEAERSFAYRNVSMEDMGLTKEGLAEKYRDTAIKQVKRHLILSKLIEQENLELSDDELENGFTEMAGSLGQSADEVKGYYHQNADKLDFFKHALLEKKAIKLIIDHSQIKTVAPKADE